VYVLDHLLDLRRLLGLMSRLLLLRLPLHFLHLLLHRLDFPAHLTQRGNS
jgi:hypothetical protein